MTLNSVLSFMRSSGRFPLEPGQKDSIVYIRITDVDEYVAKSFDPWWGIPTGGARTEEERNARQILSTVQAKVRDRLKERLLQSMTSLKSQFTKMDKSGDGILNKNELFAALENAEIVLDDDDKESVWKIVDEDQVLYYFSRYYF